MTKTERDPLAQIRSQTAAVIPAYQDEKHIGDIVRRVRQQLDYVLVVDDGSTDWTAQRAREAGAEVITHDQNRGKGEAIKTGLAHWLAAESSSRRAAGGLDCEVRWVSLLDSDGQHLPEEIDRFLAAAAGAPQPETRRHKHRASHAPGSGLLGHGAAADVFDRQPHEQPHRNAIHPARRESVHEQADQPCL